MWTNRQQHQIQQQVKGITPLTLLLCNLLSKKRTKGNQQTRLSFANVMRSPPKEKPFSKQSNNHPKETTTT